MLIDNLRKRLLKEVTRYLKETGAKNGGHASKTSGTYLSGITLSVPKNKSFGDISTNAALVLAPVLKNNPMKIAEDIKVKIISRWPEVSDISVAPPGFINFFISRDFTATNLVEIARRPGNYGCNMKGRGIKIQVEFVSANPTGNLHIGHGRWAALGDSLANIFAANGYEVSREYYVNDFGSQIAKFSACLASLYLKSFGKVLPYPQDGYPEELLKSLVDEILQEQKDAYLLKTKSETKSLSFVDKIDDLKNNKAADAIADIPALGRRGVEIMIERIASTLGSMNVKFDEWFYESSLYKESNFENTVKELEKKQVIYEKENALWFKASQYGDEKDRVVIRTGGEPTYFASDIMYLINKVKRGFNRLIYILGADHHGYIKRLHAIGRATGFDDKNIEVIIGQLVRLVEKGETVKMSKRKGNVYMLDELIEEVGSDAVRYFFSANSFDTPMDFDLDLAKQKSNQNPVYYVQYAHARIANIIGNVKKGFLEGELDFKKEEFNLPGQWGKGKAPQSISENTGEPEGSFENIFSSLISGNSYENINLSNNEELELAKTLLLYPDAVNDACINEAPYMINQYLYRLASQFHYFYKHHRIIDEGKLNTGRFKLVLLIRIVLVNALKIIGVSAPEKM